MKWIFYFYFDLNKIWESSFRFIFCKIEPIQYVFSEIYVIVVIFLCELFSWELLSWSLYCYSLVAFHILDHSKWWLKFRSRYFNLLTASCLFDIIDDYVFALLYHAYSSKSILPRFSVEEWSDVDCKTKRRFANKDQSEIMWMFRNPRKNYMDAKNSFWWDGGPVHFVEEVGIPCKYTDMVPCYGSNQMELC